MTNQELFDKTLAHLVSQGKQSVIGSVCMYRLPLHDGTVLKCAAGCHINDQDYKPEWERHPVNVPRNSYRTSFHDQIDNYFISKEIDLNLLGILQRTHDCASNDDTFVDRIKSSFKLIAQEWGLTYSYD